MVRKKRYIRLRTSNLMKRITSCNLLFEAYTNGKDDFLKIEDVRAEFEKVLASVRISAKNIVKMTGMKSLEHAIERAYGRYSQQVKEYNQFLWLAGVFERQKLEF